LTKWLAITTFYDRENCQGGIFCVNDTYESLLSQVKIGDEFVMVIPIRGNRKYIHGLYKATGEESSNSHITRHSKNSYSYIVKIEKVKIVDWIGPRLSAKLIYQADLKKYDSNGNYDSYFNHGKEQ
jgi:hypothetical protein